MEPLSGFKRVVLRRYALAPQAPQSGPYPIQLGITGGIRLQGLALRSGVEGRMRKKHGERLSLTGEPERLLLGLSWGLEGGALLPHTC